MRSTKATAAAVALIVVGLCPGVGIADADPTTTAPAPGPAPSSGPAPGPEPSSAPAAGPQTSIDANGTFTVGTDIAPGTYASAGPITNGTCSWKRTSGDSTVDNAITKKPQVVTIDPTDTTFTTRDCQPWQLTDCSQGCPSQDGSPGSILGQLGVFLAPRLGSTPPTGRPPTP